MNAATELPRLTRNQIILDTIGSSRYRILYLPSDNEGKGYWITLDSNTNIPRAFDLADVQEKLLIGTMEKAVDQSTVILDEDLSPKGTARRDRAWNLIRNVVTIEPDIYIHSRRAELLRRVETASGVKMNNLYGYLGKYWKSGFQRNALAPDYSSCGGARTASSLENRVGKRKRAGANGKVLVEQDYQNFQAAISSYYQKDNGYTLKQTYERMLAKYYVRPASDPDSAPITLTADEKPSFGQFYYWHRHHGDAVEDARSREGEHNFVLKHRAITGKTETTLCGPGDSYQIDATIGDFYLVRKNDRSLLVGRPVIVFVKDAWSRMVTGMSVTLENSSCGVWKEALFNTASPKADYCRRFGIEINETQWPCQALPVSITTDNGEFAVKAVDEIVRTLGITVENCPPYRGDLKGIIERTFNTYQLALKPFIPGYVDKDAGERGARDYRKSSCLDFETFTAILIKTVLYYNNHHYMKDYQRTADMQKRNIPAIPLHLWNYGISHMSGTLRKVSPNDCIDVLLQKGEACVTGKGIRFNSLFYTCETAVTEKWFERARVSGTYTIPVRYSSLSCERIYFKGREGEYIPCSLVNAYSSYGNYTEADMALAHENDLAAEAAYVQEEDQAYAELASFIETNVDRCRNESQSGNVIIKALNRHSIDENRKAEKDEVNGTAKALEEQAGLTGPEGGPAADRKESAKPKSFGTVSDEIDRILADIGATTWSDFSSDNQGPSE